MKVKKKTILNTHRLLKKKERKERKKEREKGEKNRRKKKGRKIERRNDGAKITVRKKNNTYVPRQRNSRQAVGSTLQFAHPSNRVMIQMFWLLNGVGRVGCLIRFNFQCHCHDEDGRSKEETTTTLGDRHSFCCHRLGAANNDSLTFFTMNICLN